MNHSVWLPITVTLIASLAGAVTDVWKFRVYNVLTFPLLASGLIYHTGVDVWSGLTTSSWGVSNPGQSPGAEPGSWAKSTSPVEDVTYALMEWDGTVPGATSWGS